MYDDDEVNRDSYNNGADVRDCGDDGHDWTWTWFRVMMTTLLLLINIRGFDVDDDGGYYEDDDIDSLGDRDS